MKGIKILNISFILFFGAFLYFSIKNEIELTLPIMITSFAVFVISRVLLFNIILKRNNILVKVKLPLLTFKKLVLPIILLIVSLLFIINYWFSIVLEGELTIIPGILLLYHTIHNFKNTIIFSNDYIVFNGEMQYAKWNRIVKCTIYNDTLNIETPYTVYNISFNKIPQSKVNNITEILNQKLSKVFNGKLSYENQELRIIENS